MIINSLSFKNKIFEGLIILAGITFLIASFFNSASVEAAAPKPSVVAQVDLGPGKSPDVIFFQDKWWVAVLQNDSNSTKKAPRYELNLYSFNADLSGQQVITIPFEGLGFEAYPRLAAWNNVLWLAYKDGNDSKGVEERVKLWRSDTQAVEDLGPTAGENPVVMGSGKYNGYIAWQQKEDYKILTRKLDGEGGTNGIWQWDNYVHGFLGGNELGLSRISNWDNYKSGYKVDRIDSLYEDYVDVTSKTFLSHPWWAGGLLVREGKIGIGAGTPDRGIGAVGQFNNNSSTTFTLWGDREIKEPHAAYNGKDLYAITAATYGSAGSTTDSSSTSNTNSLPLGTANLAVIRWNGKNIDLNNISFAPAISVWRPNATNNGWWPHLSPDGRYVAYGNWGESWITDLLTKENINLSYPPGTYPGPSNLAPSLGGADSFVVLANKYVNNDESTTLQGDLGALNRPSVLPRFLKKASLDSVMQIGNDAYNNAGAGQAEVLAELNKKACTVNFSGSVDFATDTSHGTVGAYKPGVYCVSGNASISGRVTFVEKGLYIFRISGSLMTSSGSEVTLGGGSNGASSYDVFWTPQAMTDLGEGSKFVGTVIDNSGINVGKNVNWTGRAFAFGGTVTTNSAATILNPMISPCISAQWIKSNVATFVCYNVPGAGTNWVRYEVRTGEWKPKRTADDPSAVSGLTAAQDGHWISNNQQGLIKDGRVLAKNSFGVAIDKDYVAGTCHPNNSVICVWQGLRLIRKYTGTGGYNDIWNGYITYGSSGLQGAMGITPTGKKVNLSAITGITDFAPIIVPVNNTPWIFTNPGGNWTTVGLLRPWGQTNSIILNFQSISTSVVFLKDKFVLAGCTARGDLTVITVQANSPRVNICDSTNCGHK